MQAVTATTTSRGDRVIDSHRQSISAGSSASADNAISPASRTDPSTKYAPIQPRSTQQELDRTHLMATETEPLDENAMMGSLQRYNALQISPGKVDPQLGAHVSPAGRAQTHDRQGSRVDGLATVNDFASNPRQVQNKRAASQEGISHTASTGTGPDTKEKKSQNNTAANERELRELIENNQHRTLESIARDVRNAERTQKSEKAKQLFAMRWLRQYCKQDTESVPRNRVYTYYAQRCGTERVDTLNPASFGKLVRVIFPGIQTRRLGVRGESKYHYVSLTLIDDPSNQGRPMSAQTSTLGAERGTPFDQDTDFNNSLRLPADSAAFPTHDPSFDQTQTFVETNPPSQSRLFAEPNVPGYRQDGPAPHMYKQQLKFSSPDHISRQDDILDLPSIRDYMPPKTDLDLANALTALYRTHCTSLVDAVRYVKEKQFIRLLGSFNGTMTVPVSRLFAQASLAPWIKACDRVMYQAIIRFLAQLALQVMPAQVMAMLQGISRDLPDHLRRNFRNYPEHVLQAKLETAVTFSSLVQRLLRVNETAHAAANLLINDEMRNIMWQDWVRHVHPKRVVESALTTCGHEEAFQIITVAMRHLLAPLVRADMLEQGTDFEITSLADLSSSDWLARGNPGAEGILERWANWMRSLPPQFPTAPTRTLVHCVDAVGSACLRDLTVNHAQSFGAWWIAKVWIDEMMLWLAEMGGFLEPLPLAADSPEGSEEFETFLSDTKRRDSVVNISRPQSAGLGIEYSQIAGFDSAPSGHRHSSGPPTATFELPNKAYKMRDSAAFDTEEQHDDSGIGMSLLTDGPPTGLSPMNNHTFGQWAK